MTLKDWRQIFTDLDEKGLQATYIGFDFIEESLSVFSGYHQYSEWMEMVNLIPAKKTAYYYPLYSTNGVHPGGKIDSEPKIMCATVRPGYDERNLPGRVGALVEREEGNRYRYTWRKAIECDPDWIFITSWNEWWEHSHIEPSEHYGDKYLKITREYADKWKGQ